MKRIILLIVFILVCYFGYGQWSLLNSGTTTHFTSLCFTDQNVGYVVGSNTGTPPNSIIKTTNGGSSWSVLNTGNTNPCFGVFFIDANTGYVIQGQIQKTTDGGNNWVNQSTGVSMLWSLYFTDVNNGYAVGNAGAIVKTTNGGNNWAIQTSGTTNDLTAIYFFDANNGYTVGYNGTVLKTTNAGLNWSDVSLGNSYFLGSVFFTDANTGHIVGGDGQNWNNGFISRTTNGGVNWVAQPLGICKTLNSVYFSSAGIGYAVGGYYTSGSIMKTTNGGINWIAQNTDDKNSQGILKGDPFYYSDVCFVNSDLGYIVGSNGKILKTTNGGAWIDENNSPENNLLLYPNPNSGIFSMELKTKQPEKVIVKIKNLSGICVFEKQYNLINENNLQEMKLTEIPAGLYFITIKGDKTNIVKKIIVQ